MGLAARVGSGDGQEDLASELELPGDSVGGVNGGWGRVVPQEWLEPSAYAGTAGKAGTCRRREEAEGLMARLNAEGYF